MKGNNESKDLYFHAKSSQEWKKEIGVKSTLN